MFDLSGETLTTTTDKAGMQGIFSDDPAFTNIEEIVLEAECFLSTQFPKGRIKKVLFVLPPDVDSSLFKYDTAKRGRYPNYPPYGFGIMATHLRKDGIEVEILNLNSIVLNACLSSDAMKDFNFDNIWRKALAEKLLKYKPDLVGATCMFTQTHGSLYLVCTEIKTLAPQIPLAVGGVHITNGLTGSDSEDRLVKDLEADFYFLYECDVAFRHFVEVVNKRKPVDSLKQIALNINNNLFRFSGKMVPRDDDLDEIPAHDLMNPIELSKYGKVGSYTYLIPEKTRFSTVLSNRGCRGKCTFCSVNNFNGLGVRRRGVQSVIDELLMLSNDYGVEHVMWLDDDFFYNQRECMLLLNEIVRKDIGITWDCTNGIIATSINDEMAACATESGCIGLNIGLESGNKDILKSVRKPVTIEKFLKAAEILCKFPKIFTKVFLIIGFPGETYRQLLDTIEVAQCANLDWHLIQRLQLLPNTPMFSDMLDDGLIKGEDFESIRHSAGAYGQVARKSEKDKDPLSGNFKDAFNVKNLDVVIPRERLDAIWAYMNYHLNYTPLFSENRKEKLEQKLLHLQHIYKVIAPNDAMAMYFATYLQKKLYGKTNEELTAMLNETLNKSPQWRERFKEFNLSVI